MFSLIFSLWRSSWNIFIWILVGPQAKSWGSVGHHLLLSAWVQFCLSVYHMPISLWVQFHKFRSHGAVRMKALLTWKKYLRECLILHRTGYGPPNEAVGVNLLAEFDLTFATNTLSLEYWKFATSPFWFCSCNYSTGLPAGRQFRRAPHIWWARQIWRAWYIWKLIFRLWCDVIFMSNPWLLDFRGNMAGWGLHHLSPNLATKFRQIWRTGEWDYIQIIW